MTNPYAAPEAPSQGPPPGQLWVLVMLLTAVAGLVVCQPLGPVAWAMSSIYMRKCAAGGHTPDTMAQVARIVGIAATALLPVFLLVVAGHIFFPEVMERASQSQ
ncbi:MAG: hypothetical protein KIT72_06135 [Polyangiaceae bacterium]|nr:hypothetical protein [Polyangiaceae bacterium]MCW5789979.1 hypothetical protein [Polyangiaceae bacterium]